MKKFRVIMTDAIEKAKRAAAYQAVDESIHNNCIVGIGSGTTMCHVLERLSQRCEELDIRVKCIPTSYQSKQLIYDFGLEVTELSKPDCMIDVTIDGADEVDSNLVAIKGGGACLAQEKVIAAAAREFIVVADHRKNSRYLGQAWKKGIPIEVLPMAAQSVRGKISRSYCIDVDEVHMRIGKEKAGPVITDNGNFVLDWKFKADNFMSYSSDDWQRLSNEISLFPGVVEVGLFPNMISRAYFGLPDGEVIRRGVGPHSK